jgi:Flp pilus assembly protein TadG
MRFRILAAALACACALAVAGRAAAQGDQSKQADVKVSSGERDAATKIDKAQGPEAKLQAAAEFIKKYPKSALRPQVAQAVAREIANAQDNQLKISLAETYLTFFTDPSEATLVNDTLLNAYLNSGHADEAFKMGAARLAKNPEDIDLMRALTIVASNEAIQGRNTYAAQGQQYGAKAVELLEADKRPAGIDDAKWAAYKANSLQSLYRALGVIAFKTNDQPAAIAHFEKAIALKLSDPVIFHLVGELNYDEYSQLAKQYQAMPEGAEKSAALKKVEEQMDKTIEAYARALALTQANEQLKAANDQARQNLEDLYKFRHKGSTEGLQQIIDKYKRPATQ